MKLYPHTIHVRVSEQQRAALLQAARREHTHPSVLLRDYVQTLVPQPKRRKR